MSDVVGMIKTRRGDKSVDSLAREIGLQTVTLYRYLAGTRKMSRRSVQVIADWARRNGDTELVAALAAHSLGFDVLSWFRSKV